MPGTSLASPSGARTSRSSGKTFVENELPQRLEALGRFFDANPAGTRFWGGASLTFADMPAFAYLDDIEALFPGALLASPQLAGFRERFAERPRLAAYLQSSRRPAAIQYGPAGKIYPADSRGPHAA